MSCTKATAGPGLGLQAPQIEAVPVASATRSGPGAGCHWQCPLAVTVTVTRDRDGEKGPGGAAFKVYLGFQAQELNTVTEPRSHGRIFNGLQVITSLSLSMFYQSGLRTGQKVCKILILVSNHGLIIGSSYLLQIQLEACPRASANQGGNPTGNPRRSSRERPVTFFSRLPPWRKLRYVY